MHSTFLHPACRGGAAIDWFDFSKPQSLSHPDKRSGEKTTSLALVVSKQVPTSTSEVVNAPHDAGRPQEHRNTSAFTLIEIILVVLIIGLIAALAVPSFDNALRGQRLDSAAHSIATACQQARYEAVFGNRSCWYVLDMDNQQIRLLLGAAPGTNGLPTYEEIAAETNLVDSAEASPAELVEMPKGVTITKVQSQDGTIQDSGKIGFPFYSNGVCEPFRIFLLSENGEQRAMDVDMFTAKATVFTPQ